MESDMSGDDMIAADLPCRACAYNLRGLSFKGVCPECGESIPNSVASATAHLAKILGEDRQNMARHVKYLGIAQNIDCSVNALLFVKDAIQQARRIDPTADMNAAWICQSVQTRAKSYFNDADEARELLDEWGIRGSEDVGKIVFGLVQHGLLQTSNGDTMAQYYGLLSLEDLFPPKT